MLLKTDIKKLSASFTPPYCILHFRTCNGEYLQRTRPTDEQREEPGNDFCEDAKLFQQRVLI